MINYKEFVNNSRKWLAEYIKVNHLQSLVIGISGGIDSTVSCCIASKVCKDLNIPLIGRSLPTTTNTSDENKAANLVGNAFCTDFKEVNISAECQKLIYELELNEGEMSRLQEGNIKARVRMIYLRHLASLHKGVVLDNDNFTEWNLGFWTVCGDSPMDINLGLHYLWKTEIYELAQYLLLCYDDGVDEEKFQAIRTSINLTPTDGNGVSNSDCEQFGLDNYEQVDDILKFMYNPDLYNVIKEITRLKESYNEQGIHKIINLNKNSNYKRKELPIKPTKEELGL